LCIEKRASSVLSRGKYDIVFGFCGSGKIMVGGWKPGKGGERENAIIDMAFLSPCMLGNSMRAVSMMCKLKVLPILHSSIY
jgi:hypothetical protein